MLHYVSGFRRNDEKWYFSTFYEFINIAYIISIVILLRGYRQPPFGMPKSVKLGT